MSLVGLPEQWAEGVQVETAPQLKLSSRKSKLTAEVILSYLDATFFPCHLLENAKFLETYLSQ